MASTREALAELLWLEIRASGMRQLEVAAEAGITEKHLSQILHLKVGASANIVDRILSVLGRRLVLATAVDVEHPGGDRTDA
ncbi:helix-turn-helix transcriptional regulator [Dactylosporangium roseum]|uniref:Helix-turn-helix transcriptional regulator n=1 Tax=Dactylosporangium roseum TaxID=47989 RepID=A0ABY5Z656_9ACTN|nr:helix-turn-helix transcriptional regulator [Dactylosporangium roseum]UWZ37524.1 helix-turn-helix transcriptional regulator [Dactylosporangium roseum]